MNLHSAATRLSERLLRFFARDLPPDLQPWGDAMMAELPAVEGVVNPLLWALGGGAFLSKALFVRALTGDGLRRAGPPGIHPPSPTQRMAFLAALLSLAMLFSPVFREAIQTSLQSWSAAWPEESAAELNRVAATVRQQQDAAALAFAALCTKDLRKSADLAEQAVAKDPQFTWILAEIVARSMNQPLSGSAMPRALLVGYLRQLQQWDPDNATPYLLAAQMERQAAEATWPKPFSYQLSMQTAEALSQKKVWLGDMQQAFAVPRFDTYVHRRMRLEGDILARTGTHNPRMLVDGVLRQSWPGWQDIKNYADYLRIQGDREFLAGHLEEAEIKYLSVVRFSQRRYIQAQTNFERMAAIWPEMEAQKRLAALYHQWQRPDAEMRSKEAAVKLQAERESWQGFGAVWRVIFGPVTGLGISVSVASGLAVLSMMGTLLGIGYFFSRRWLGFQAGRRLNAVMDGAGKYGPLVLFASCVSLYGTYRPYALLFHNYMSSKGSADPEQLRVFLELRFFPALLTDGLSRIAPLEVLFWMAIIAVLSLIVLSVVWRWTPFAKSPRVTG